MLRLKIELDICFTIIFFYDYLVMIRKKKKRVTYIHIFCFFIPFIIFTDDDTQTVLSPLVATTGGRFFEPED